MAWIRGTPWPIDQIREWILSGKTHRWVAAQLGTADQRISKLCQQHGIVVHRRGPRNGTGHPNWKGGRIVSGSGYVLIYCPDHPAARRVHKTGGYVWEHRLVMEKHLGRFLARSEVVHHKNKNKTDNRIENLEVFESNAEHLRHELTGQCPKWTPAGKAKLQRVLQAGNRRYRQENAIRKAKEADVQPSNRSDRRCSE